MISDFNLTNKVAIVTGGGGLLALEHAIALCEHGAKVILTDFNIEKAEKNKFELNKLGYNNIQVVFHDVTKKSSWEDLLFFIVNNISSKVDILINNAAFTNASRSPNYNSDFFDFDIQDWNMILEVNLTGTFLGCQIIGNHMKKNKKGSIINFSSLYGIVSPHHLIYQDTGISQPVAYSVSKTGILGLTRYLAALLAPYNVRVNSITPGGIFDGQNEKFVKRFEYLCPSNQMQDKSDLRGAIILLSSEASRQIIGQNIIIDGGWTIW